MDKFKSHLLTALGVAVVMLTIMLFTSRQAITQSTLAIPPTKIPFQIEVSDPATGAITSFTVPPGRYLIIETVGLFRLNGSFFSSPYCVPITTKVGANTTTFPISFMPISSPAGAAVASFGLVSTKLYADPGSTVTVDTTLTGGRVSISGILVKTLP